MVFKNRFMYILIFLTMDALIWSNSCLPMHELYEYTEVCMYVLYIIDMNSMDVCEIKYGM